VSYTNYSGGTLTWSFAGDANYNAATSTFPVIIAKAADASTVTTDVQTQMYTGSVKFTAKLAKMSIGGEVAAQYVTFAVGTGTNLQPMCGGQQAPLVSDGNGGATASVTCSLLETTAIGSLDPANSPLKNVVATFGGIGNDIAVSPATSQLTVTPKAAAPVAAVLYTGETVFWTPSLTSNSATMYLSATVRDACTSLPAGYQVCGDISKAKVTFGIRNSTGGFTALTGALPVGYVNSTDHAVGSAAASTQYSLSNSANSADMMVAVKVSGYYAADNPGWDELVTVSKPIAGNELKFSGTNLLHTTNTSAGVLKAKTGSLTGVAGDITYTNKGTNPQGSITMTVVSDFAPDGSPAPGSVYYIKSNAISTLSITAAAGTSPARADFTGKVSILKSDGTSVDGGALIQISVTKGKASLGTGTVMVQVNNSKTGGVWFSAAWDSALGKSIAKAISTGEIIVQ
jgi:hypothetical protein